MEVMAILQMVVLFITAHWDSLALVAGSVGALGLALRARAYGQFAALALDLVRQVAVKELSGPEKRKWVVTEGYKRLPLWAKKLVTEAHLEAIVEKTYQMLKGELPTKPQPIPTPESVDPTKGVLNEEEMRITAPIKIEE